MRRAIGILATLFLSAAAAGAQDLNNRQLVVKGGDVEARNAPVSVSYDGPEPATSIEVVDASGRAFPATLRGGELVFVPDSVPASREQSYTVRVLEERRPPRVEVTQKGDEPVLEVRVDGKPVTAYHYGVDRRFTFEQAKAAIPDLTEADFRKYDATGDGEWSADDLEPNEEAGAKALARIVHRKPFLWPVLAEGDVTMTRNWPLGEKEGPTDHLHQKSMWSSHGDINGASVWEEDYGKSGFEHVNRVEFGSGDAYGWIRSENVWQDHDRRPVLTEVREYRFYATPASARTFDTTLEFVADQGDVTFGDTKEGGLIALRIRPELQEKGGSGTITTTVGQGEKAVWGKPSPWCDYSGTIQDVGVRGVTFFDHPSNLRHPTRWHVRSYGLMAANCFGLKDFEPNGGQSGDWTLRNGESQVFRYRTLIHSGDVKEAKVAERYAAFATPPQASWK